jgi:small GTP-binding protein
MYNSNNSSNNDNINIYSSKTVKKIKLVLLGNSAAGKTCIVQRMVNNMFNINNSLTIGAAYTIYSVETNIKIEIWDTAGQERFHSLLPLYARGAEIIIVVIDIEKNIDEQFLKWNKYIQENETLFSPHFKLFLIFTKHDLNSGFEIPETVMNQPQFTFITLVSAKTGHNIDKLKFHLELTAKKIVDECARRSHEFANTRRNSRGITDNNNGINGNIGMNGNNGMNSNNSNNANGDNDTVFGSTFSNINMKINVDLSEYKEKMKRYYENPRC